MTQDLPETMTAVLLTGHGGLEMLALRHDVAVPRPQAGEVLIKVAAAGINNTDINTRTAWYSKGVTQGTDQGGAEGFQGADDADGSWSGTPLGFPRIQGADCCGQIVAVGAGVDQARIGERILVQALWHDEADEGAFSCRTFGSECDGGFAQYAKATSRNAHRVESDWTDAELASIPCAYSTAENLMARAGVAAGETVLITGASGGVGSAAVQLAKRRGAAVVALSGAAKAGEVAALGADRVLDRDADLTAVLGRKAVDVVVDLVGGPSWPALLEILTVGGRYATAGAIAGPLVELDLRTLYLKDLSLIGCTFQADHVFPDLIGYIERGEIRPLVAQTYPLADIVQAQQDFLAKNHTGKLVLIPPR